MNRIPGILRVGVGAVAYAGAVAGASTGEAVVNGQFLDRHFVDIK